MDDIVQKLCSERRGGYCFEQNALLAAALRTIGFSVCTFPSRTVDGADPDVSNARPPKAVPENEIPLSGPSHVVVVVILDGQRWVCDHGYAGAVYLPVLLEDKAVTSFCKDRRVRRGLCGLKGEDLSLAQTALHGWYMQRWSKSKDAWLDLYFFQESAFHHEDWEFSNWYLSTHPNSKFRHVTFVGIWTDDKELLESCLQLAGPGELLRALLDTCTAAESSGQALTPEQVLQDALRFLQSTLCATEASLLGRHILPAPSGNPNTYRTFVSEREPTLKPSAVGDWAFENLLKYFSPDDTKVFAVAHSPPWSPSFDCFMSKNKVEAGMQSEVWDPLGYAAAAIDGAQAAIWRLGHLGHVPVDSALHSLQAAIIHVETATQQTFCLAPGTRTCQHWVGGANLNTHEQKHLRKVLPQLLGHMKLGRVAFGVITTYATHVFATRPCSRDRQVTDSAAVSLRAGLFGNSPATVKWACMFKHGHLEQAMSNEAKIYRHLHSHKLDGEAVAALLAAGFLETDGYRILGIASLHRSACYGAALDRQQWRQVLIAIIRRQEQRQMGF
ncbi:hypothetical protein WJX73_009270 [Symbiochloris irregularis]|uniref:Arylamine N-acetyltransferase n=1 Tax=Symbiochloris irregularis TaxID=706552 RepID=A0AAW1NU83_9CHLO